MPVGRMLEQITSRELAEWQAFFMIEKERANDSELDRRARQVAGE